MVKKALGEEIIQSAIIDEQPAVVMLRPLGTVNFPAAIESA